LLLLTNNYYNNITVIAVKIKTKTLVNKRYSGQCDCKVPEGIVTSCD